MKRVHVSLHDVCPLFEPALDLALELCARVGVRPGLLVVPDFHGRGSLRRSPAFVEKLKRLAGLGSEIFLHGYYHRGDASRGGLGALWFQRLLSSSEAEFGALDLAIARRRIDDGLALFHELGLPVHGFVPPAWVMPKELLPLLATRGVRYSETHLEIFDPLADRAQPSLVLNFATRSRMRLHSSIAFTRWARPLSRLLPARIALHPGDVRSQVARREVEGLLSWGRGSFVTRAAELFT